MPRSLLCILVLALGCAESSEGDTTAPASEATEQGNTGPSSSSEADSEDSDTTPLLNDVDEANQDCEPSCEGVDCGSDGCGGSCGICGEGFSCESGFCMEICAPQVGTICVSGNVYWVDSCGVMGLEKEICGPQTTCENGACVNCTFSGAVECEGNTVVEIDNCGNIGSTLETCAEDALCTEGECVIAEHPYSGLYSIEVKPTDIPIGLTETPYSFAPTQIQLLVDGNGKSSILFTGQTSPLPAFAGTLSLTQLTGFGTYMWDSGDHEFNMDVHIQLIFTTYNESLLVQGNIQHWVTKMDSNEPTEMHYQDITGVRIEE